MFNNFHLFTAHSQIQITTKNPSRNQNQKDKMAYVLSGASGRMSEKQKDTEISRSIWEVTFEVN